MSNNRENPSPPQPIQTEVFEIARKFIEMQNNEQQVRLQEIQATSKDHDNQKEIALASINAQKEDRKESRETYQAESTKNKMFIFAVVLVLAILAVVLIQLGYASLAEEIIKYALAAVLGAFGGYGYAIRTISTMRNQED